MRTTMPRRSLWTELFGSLSVRQRCWLRRNQRTLQLRSGLARSSMSKAYASSRAGLKHSKINLSACLKNYFGRHCAQACRCHNQKPCDHITGRCQCPKGYTGHSCTQLCPLGVFGNDCGSKCDCGDNAECDPINGKCFCKPGHEGKDCKKGKSRSP